MLTRRYLLAFASAAFLRAEGRVEITFDGSAFRVLGLDGSVGAESIFAVYAGMSPDAPAMLGEYSFADGVLTFRPRFPISAGVPARAVVREPGREPVTKIFEAAARKAQPATTVQQVYPTADVLPANLLRLYVQFSAPMQRGEAWDHIRLLDRSGKPLDLPFLELDQELWDREERRLTVLFDPGRIKRGVLPREEAGSALIEGSSYTLVIGSQWRDANNSPLQSEYRKKFSVAPEARTGIDLKTWRMNAPRAGTKDALTAGFPAPLDYALLHRMVTVRGVPGSIEVARQETQWRFLPDAAWTAGAYHLDVNTALEDVAGNRVGRPFDVDTFEPITARLTRKIESLPFRVRS